MASPDLRNSYWPRDTLRWFSLDLMASPGRFLCVWMAFMASATFQPTITLSEDPLSTYIVHMDRSAMPSAFSDHHSWVAATLSTAAEHSPDMSSSAAPDLLYVYEHAIHGFSARLSPAQYSRLQRSHGILAAYPDMPVKLDTTHTFEFLKLNPSSGLWPASNYGEGVIIGVVDTGVWPENESYKDDGMPDVPSRWRGACEEGTDFNSSLCNRKLIGARYFSKGLRRSKPSGLKISMNSPRDTQGHGTHTSSTAAGTSVKNVSFFGYAPGTARGMAPRAHVAVYKALFEEGNTSSDIIAAIDRAISDGVDIISLSLGIDNVPLHRDPVAIAAYAAMEKGIFVSTSTGNSGPFLTSLHNGTPWVLTVGAASFDREFGGTVVLGDGTSIFGTSLYAGKTSPNGMPLVFMGACDNLTTLMQVGRKIVLCETLPEDVSLAKSILSEVPHLAGGLFICPRSYYLRNQGFSFPGALISPSDGRALLRYVRGTPAPTARLRFRMTVLGKRHAPSVATYSSRGPSNSCPNVLKPDIVAPGTMVLAAWPLNKTVDIDVGPRPEYSHFNLLSGSSMSCPHASGIAALLKAAYPDWSPAAIRSAMMTTADLLDDTGKAIQNSDNPATPLDMGSGHVNPNRALDPGLVFDAGAGDYIRLLCSMNYTKSQILTITKASVYNCSSPSDDLNYPSFIAYYPPGAAAAGVVREFRRTLTNVVDGSWTYVARLTPMEGFSVGVQPSKLTFQRKNERQSFKLRIEAVAGTVRRKVVHGSLSWVDDRGQHVVNSPIVAAETTILGA